MRIIVAAPDQLFFREGGLRTQVLRTVEEMQRHGASVDMFTGTETLAGKGYDIAHVFSMNLPTYFKAKVLRDYGIPMVFSSVMWRSGNPKLVRAVVAVLDRLPKLLLNDVVACRKMSRWAEGVLPNTNAEMEWLVKAIGVDRMKCHVVPNGVDQIPENNFKGVDLRGLGKAPYVLFCGVIDPRKNVRLLVEVASELGLPICLAGPIGDAETAEWVRLRAGVGSGVTYLGPLKYHSVEMAALYYGCRVFCLPSQYETPGIAALEALSTGARIVITSVGGTKEYFGEFASYVEPGSRSSLRGALLRAWEQGRHSDVHRCRSFLEGYSWATVAKKTLNIYSDILSQRA